MSGSIILVAAAPVRADPSHRAERVTEWLCGEVVTILERADGWVRGRGPDGYEGWVTRSAILRREPSQIDAWRRDATLWSLETELLGAHARALNRLPWGARACPASDGRVVLPDGAVAVPRDPDRLVPEDERADRFPAIGEAIVSTASQWSGAPYVWGGRTRAGVDCSGLVQAVYALHGISLPRDSGPQLDVGPTLDLDTREPEAAQSLEPGDLVFFAPEGRGISHVAICTGGNGILHAAASNGHVAMDDLGGEGELARLLRGSIAGATRPLAQSG